MYNLQEASYEMMQSAFDKPNDADRSLYVRFGLHPHPNTERSALEGRPIFDDREYIMIMVPGDKESVVHRPVWEQDKRRFAQQYAAFKNSQSQEAASGTPLKLMPWLTVGQIKELEYFNCTTVEHLALMPDSTAQKFMQINKYKQLAKDYLKAAEEAAPLVSMRAELDARDSQLEAANRQIQELAARLSNLEKAKK